MVLSTLYRGTKAAQFQRMFLPEKLPNEYNCVLQAVIKPENVASSNNIQHILKIVIFNKFSLGVGACVYAVYLSMCV